MHDALEAIKRQGDAHQRDRPFGQAGKLTKCNTSRRSYVAIYGLDYRRLCPLPHDPGPDALGADARVQDRGPLSRPGKAQARLVATTPAYTDVHKIELASGRFLTEEDDLKMSNYVVLGSDIADELFPFEDPIGQTVKLGTSNSFFYKVVGVLKDRMPTGGTGGSQSAEDFNHDVYLPLGTCKVRFGENIYLRSAGSRAGERVQLHQVVLTVDADINNPEGRNKVKAVGDSIKEMLLHRTPETGLGSDNPARQARRGRGRADAVHPAVGGDRVDLAGGRRHRHYEHHARHRNGADPRNRHPPCSRRAGSGDITLQFLVEAVVQTTIGGVLGVAVGLSMIYVIPFFAMTFFDSYYPARLHVPSIFISLLVSVGVGVLFGWYPASSIAARPDRCSCGMQVVGRRRLWACLMPTALSTPRDDSKVAEGTVRSSTSPGSAERAGP